MKLNKVLVLGAGLLVVSMAWAVGEIYKDQAMSAIQITNQGTSLDIETNEVHYIREYLGDYSKQILLKAQSVHKTSTNLEGEVSNTVIEARSQKDFFATVLWTVTDAGNQVRYFNDEFIASKVFGCCGDYERSTIYNVDNGKSPATILDDDFFSISVPNSGLGKRYFAQVEDKTAPPLSNGQNYLGSMGYFNADGKPSIVRFYTKVPNDWSAALTDLQLVNLAGKSSKNEIQDKSMELWDTDGIKAADQAFKNFGISGKVMFDTTNLIFTIPIIGDQINAAGVQVSPGLSFVIVP